MKKEFISDLEFFFKEKIESQENHFVFTTDIVAQSWAEWCITENHTSVRTVALERFLAWDKFKGAYVSAAKKDYTVIPSILRQIFVYNLIKENIEKPFLKKIIRPEFSTTAYSFSEWLSQLLPGLYYWNKCIANNKDEYGELDDEDLDLKCIFDKYSLFLEENHLFEPSWVEDIEISDKEKNFYIIYPEQIQDFCDFETIFKKAENVTAILLPEQKRSPVLYFYPDARKEFRQTMLRMIQLVNEKNAAWNEIALSVPDIEFYKPYLEREFELYEIPFVIRSGSSLIKNCAGRIFSEIKDCHTNNFSFDSVRSLLLDDYVPWKKKISFNMAKANETASFVEFNLDELREKLIREGNRLRCITDFEEKSMDGIVLVDSWEKALLQTYRSNKDIHKLYSLLKKDISNFFNCTSFQEIQSAWFTFKNDFIDEEDFSSDSNLILSRCITHLEEIIRIEKDYQKCNLTVISPYDFFIKLLESKKYMPQTEKAGLSVFPYKLSASAYFKYQFVIDGNQKNLDVPYKKLSFLSNEKRKKLKLLEEDQIYNATNAIISLYARNTETCDENFVHFTASEKSFSGFAIPHSFLTVDYNYPDYDDKDFILNCQNWFSEGAKETIVLSEKKSAEIKNWIKNTNAVNENYSASGKIKELIDYSLVENRNNSINRQIEKIEEELKTEKSYDNKKFKSLLEENLNLLKDCISGEDAKKFKITARSDLDKFYDCPRKWIFSTILGLKDDSLDLSLIKPADIGILNHYILEQFMKKFAGKKLPYYENGDFYCESQLENGANPDNGTAVLTEDKESEDIKTINKQKIVCTEEIIQLLCGDDKNKGIIYDTISSQKLTFLESPVIQKILFTNFDKIFSQIFSFLKDFLKPFAVDDDSGEIKAINGAGGCYVFYIENSFARPDNHKSFIYYGKMDCVLRTPEKQFLIIDYKQSDSSFIKGDALYPDENGLLNHFQMQVYCRLLSENLEKELAGAYFYCIKDGSSSAVVDKYSKDSIVKSTNALKKGRNLDNFIPSIQVCDLYANDFKERIINSNYEPVKDKNKKSMINVSEYENCISCSFKTICRHTFTIGQKNIKTINSAKRKLWR